MSSILKTKRFGVILRTYANKPEDIEKRIKANKKTVEILEQVTIDGQKVFSRFDILVWADKRFSDADCGLTAAALRKSFDGQPNVKISEVENGDLFCGLLNYAVARQTRDRIDYSLILSTDARSYANQEVIESMLEALENGAKVTGLAINELTQSILDGRIANTFCIWDNISLLSVGGFDLRAAKPADNRLATYMRGWSDAKKDTVYYHLAGVEEVIPLARLVEMFGECLAPILPTGEGIQGYEVPDPVKQPELYLRHISKMGTKTERQTALLSSVGFDITYLMGGVMAPYRKKKYT